MDTPQQSRPRPVSNGMKNLRVIVFVLFLITLATAFYLGWSENGPSLGFWPFLK